MFLGKINKLFDDAFLYEDDIKEDENGEYVELYEVSDNIGKCISYTTDNYIDAINKVHILIHDFVDKYRTYINCERTKIKISIIKNKYYINEERDDIIEVVDETTLLDAEIKREI